jgi:O-antigen/teichoic acid export membrane protein
MPDVIVKSEGSAVNGAVPAAVPVRTSSTTGGRLVLNTASNLAGQIIVFGLTFFSTPYITRRLGADQYGSLCLLMTYLFAFSLLNLGINISLVKYLSAMLPKGEFAEMRLYFSTALITLVGLGAAIGGGVCLLAGPIVHHFFNGPPQLTEGTILSLRIASMAFVLQFLCQVASAVPAAAQRFDVLNLIRAGSEVVRVAGTVGLLYIGCSLPALLCVVLFSSICSCAAYLVASKKLVPELSLIPRFSRPHLRTLLSHSKYILIGNVGNHIVGSADNFIIGYFLPVSSLAYYSIPYTLGSRLFFLVANVLSAVFPAASRFSGSDQTSQLRELYLRGTKISAVVACFPAFVLALFSHKFLLFWLGRDYADQGATVLILLTFAFLLNSFSLVPYQVLQGAQHAKTAAKYTTVYAVINVVLFFGLIPPFGIRGAAGAFLVAQLLFIPWFVGTANRLLDVSWGSLLSNCYGRVFLCAVAACAVSQLCASRARSLLSLGVIVSISLLAYCILVLVAVLDGRERSTCLGLLRQWAAPLQKLCFGSAVL